MDDSRLVKRMMRCLVEAGGVGWWQEFELLDKFGLKGDLGDMPGSI